VSAKIVVESLVTVTDSFGKPVDAGWKTDMIGSRYWAGRRFAELNERGTAARLTTRNGDVIR
jgi:hypothetical protein